MYNLKLMQRVLQVPHVCLSVHLTAKYQRDTHRTEFVNFHNGDSYQNLLGNSKLG
jgi:hypothetical protein